MTAPASCSRTQGRGEGGAIPLLLSRSPLSHPPRLLLLPHLMHSSRSSPLSLSISPPLAQGILERVEENSEGVKGGPIVGRGCEEEEAAEEAAEEGPVPFSDLRPPVLLTFLISSVLVGPSSSSSSSSSSSPRRLLPPPTPCFPLAPPVLPPSVRSGFSGKSSGDLGEFEGPSVLSGGARGVRRARSARGWPGGGPYQKIK